MFQKVTTYFVPNNPAKNGIGGIWSWNNNGNWADFDLQASKQIDDQIRNQWKNTKSTLITFPITKGPWFSQKKNLGVYFCNVQLNHARTKIKAITQQNTNTGFGRQMQRTPPFQRHPHNKNNNNHNNNKNSNKNSNKNNNKNSNKNNNNNKHNSKYNNKNNNSNYSNKNKNNNSNNSPYNSGSMYGNNNNNNNSYNTGSMYGNISNSNNNPYGYTPTIPSNAHFGTMSNGPQVNNDGSVCWSWQDDYQWKAYDNSTVNQIENAYNSNQKSVPLDQGPYFGAHNRKRVYMIQFNKQSIPHSFAQMNTMTSFTRKVARTGGQNNQQSNNNSNNSNDNTNNNKDNSNDSNNDDKHYKWRAYYKPMTIGHFKKLKDKDKLCNICFCEFDEKELFENECEEFKKQMESQSQPEPESQTNEEKKEEKKEEKDADGDSEIIEINNRKSQNSDNNNINLSMEILNKISDNTIIYLCKCSNNDHYFHAECISRWLKEKGKCSHCQKRYAIETGTQPLTGRLTWQFISYSCTGYESYGSIKIQMEFDSGIQGPEHYHPGQPYSGDHREAYFPNNKEGRECLELTKIAWERRLIFTIGASLTTKRENRIVWGSIHFKSRLEGGQQRHGYPDDTYFMRFKDELKAKGVTVDDLDQQATNNVKNGYNTNYGSM